MFDWQGSAGTECPFCEKRACSERRADDATYYVCECCGYRWQTRHDVPADDSWSGILLPAVFW